MPNGEPLTTDQKHTPDDEAALSQLEESSSNGNLTPAGQCKVSESSARLVTDHLAKTKTPNVSVSLDDLRQSIPEDLDNVNLDNLVQEYEQCLDVGAFQGQTNEDAQGAQTLADPVMMFNGQFVHTAQDFKTNGAGMDFVFTRTYKNQTYYEGPLGVNWDHNYNLYLRVEFGGNVIVRSSGELREDRYVLHQQHNYYLNFARKFENLPIRGVI